MNLEESDMSTDTPTQPDPPNRFAVPMADLESVHMSQTQMVELARGPRPPDPAQSPVLAGPDADGDGD